MPKLFPMQESFAAGEITPRLLSQTSNPAFKAGVGTMKNFVSTPQGPFYRRPGSRYIADFPGRTAKAIGFPVTRNIGYGIIITAPGGKIYVGDGAGQASSSTNFVLNHNFYNLGANWTANTLHDGQINFDVGKCEMVGGSHPSALTQIRQTITVSNPANLHSIQVDCNDAVDYPEMIVQVGTSLGAFDLVDEHVLSKDIGKIDFTPGVATIYLQIEVHLHASTVNDRRDVRFVHLYEGTPVPVEFANPWTEEEIPFLQYDWVPGEHTVFITSPFSAPRYINYNLSTDTWTAGVVSFTAQPSSWGGTNWPRTVQFFQGRSWWGGEPLNPEYFYASQSFILAGNYTNMSVGSGLDAEAIHQAIGQKGAIYWMVGLKNLIFGTEFGEYIATSDGGVITPSDIQVDLQSSYGSAPIQAEKIGNKALYVTADNKKIRDIGYLWTDEAWVSRDITFSSEHITEDREIQDIVFFQNPNNLIFCVTNRQEFIMGTYERGNDIIGWHRHETQGILKSVCAVRSSGVDRIVGTVWRDIEATDRIYVELDALDTQMDMVQEVSDYHTPITSISFPTFKNQTVQVKVDGAVHPDITLDASGNGTLVYEGSLVQVGLGYHAIMRSLPFSRVLDATTSALSMMKRWNKIIARVIDSAAPIINGDRPPTRSPSTPMNEPEPVRTEDIVVTNVGWDRFGSITIEQDLPLETTITGFFGEISVESL